MNTLDLNVTQAAATVLRSGLDEADDGNVAVRIEVEERGLMGLHYDVDLVGDWDQEPDDLVLVIDNGVTFWVRPGSAMKLQGATIDYEDRGFQGAGFKFLNPINEISPSDPISLRLQKLIDKEINPGVAAHGGEISVVEVRGDTAYLKMGGGCQGCGSAAATLRQGIETRVKALMPEIAEIIDVTDHSAGRNPYFPKAG